MFSFSCSQEDDLRISQGELQPREHKELDRHLPDGPADMPVALGLSFVLDGEVDEHVQRK